MKYKFFLIFFTFIPIFSADHLAKYKRFTLFNSRGYQPILVCAATKHDTLKKFINKFHSDFHCKITSTFVVKKDPGGISDELNLDQTIEDLGLWPDDKRIDDIYAYFFIENKELIVRTLTGKQIEISVNYLESIGHVKEKVLEQMTPENGFPVKPDFDKITFNHNGKNIPPYNGLYSIDNLWDYPLTMIIRP